MTASKCEHCTRDFAFGVYRLTQAAYSYWTEDRRTGERVKRWIDEKTFEKQLCADCGFNIVNFRKASHNEYVSEMTYPSGKKFTTREETMSTRAVYTACVLITVLHNAMPIYKEAHLPPRAIYEAELKHLRAMKGMAGPGEPPRAYTEQQHQTRVVVVPALGGASARRREKSPEVPPAHGIGSSSPEAGVRIGTVSRRATPVATTLSPRKRG